MFTKKGLHQALADIGVTDAGEIFEELERAYSEPGRHYHGRAHVAECLEWLGEYAELALHRAEIEVAIWFHDAVYDSRKGDNEEQSAEWAARYLQSQDVDTRIIERVHAMILATKTHQAEGSDALLMLDIDLAVLGSSADAFERYDAAIRREYAWVPEEHYLAGRIAVLDSFLKRPAIYGTPEISRRLEESARTNLKAKIYQLRSLSGGA